MTHISIRRQPKDNNLKKKTKKPQNSMAVRKSVYSTHIGFQIVDRI